MMQWMQSEVYASYYNQISVSNLDPGKIKTEIMC